MTKGARAVVLAALLVACLSWALLHSFDDGERYGRDAKQAVGRLELAQSDLLKNVLLARAGLLQNYDPLVADANDLRLWSRRLASMPETPPEVARKIIDGADRTENMLEQFKSLNAILQNSLAYFDTIDASIATSSEDSTFKIEVASLASGVTHLLRDPSQENARAVRQTLDVLSERFASTPDVVQLRQHGSLLMEAIPSTNKLLHAIQKNVGADDTRDILLSIAHHREGSERKRLMGDLALYASLLLIFVLLVWTYKLLRGESDALRWTILRERLAFEASSLFIACPPELVDQRLSEMMKLLLDGYRSERVYLLKLDGTEQMFIATRRDDGNNEWPRALFPLVPQLLALPVDALRLPYDRIDMPVGLREIIFGTGLRTWSFVKVRLEGEVVALLCFDRLIDIPVSARYGYGNLHLLANVVSNAFLRQRLSRKRVELETKLRRAERLEAIGTFTSGVAHNFNNLIGAIVGQAEMAIDRIPDDHAAAGHVRQVIKTSSRARDVADQILDFGRIGGSLRQDVDVARLVEETAACLPADTLPDITVVIHPYGGHASTSADPAKLQQVFHNVILNAVQASGPGARVDVTVGLEATSERHFLRSSIRAGYYVCVAVKDTGLGIDSETRERIFQPFFTTRTTGTGLGLATALETVVELDGGIELDSEIGIGTTVTIWLPSTQRVHDSPTRASLTGKTIMVVNGDREGVLRDEDLLATLGFEPIGFTDPAVALKALHDADERFDVLIVDKHIAGMSLEAFVTSARKSFAGGKRVIATGSSIEAVTLERLDVSAFVSRPWQPRMVLAVIGGLLTVPGPASSASGSDVFRRRSTAPVS